MAGLVYILCALTSLLCAWLLFRGYRRTRARLLLWSGLCFSAWAVNNALLFMDFIVFPTAFSLFWPRSLAALTGILLLLYGLIWDNS